MKTSVADFLELVRNDAAVQEQMAVASKEKEPLDAMLRVAAAAGFGFTIDDLRSALTREQGDAALENVVGGLSSPLEWFAEGYTNRIKRSSQ
jgi:predicted ribosomally synthesized peptide with nif11-like leader